VGSVWEGRLVDQGGRQDLSIPNRGQAFSYVINTLNQGTFGTGQDQSAPMVARYPDTAYRSNGNYGVQYSLSLPLQNMTRQTQAVSIMLQTPLKRDEASQGLQFLEPPSAEEVFYRGTIRIAYQDDFGLPRTRSIHVVQNRGQQGEPLITMTMPPDDRRLVTVDFIYPPDATPPQILTIRSTDPATTLSELRDSNGNVFTDQPGQLPGQLPGQPRLDRPNSEARTSDAVILDATTLGATTPEVANPVLNPNFNSSGQNSTPNPSPQSLIIQSEQNLGTSNPRSLGTLNPTQNLDTQSLGSQSLGSQSLGNLNPTQNLDTQNLGVENLSNQGQTFNLDNQTTTQNRRSN
jgi:hypothetical protein